VETSSGGRRDPRKRLPWYGSGLRFSCVADCGACCTKHGDYDFVYLEPGDIVRLAAHFDLGGDEFMARYGALDDGHAIVRMDGPGCPFLSGARCTVYDARPSQCRTFPFWRENLRTRSSWERLREFCPGVGEGEDHSFETIRARLDRPPDPED
jgi:Fe-S-cluster containining protein